MLQHSLYIPLIVHCFIVTASVLIKNNDVACPHEILKKTIENLSCNGSAYMCAVEARTSAHLVHADEMSGGFAWGAMVLRSDLRIKNKISWSLPSQPISWYCSGKTHNGWSVLIFRTGTRFIPSDRDHWWWYSTHHKDTCPLSLMRAYFSQVRVEESIEPGVFLKMTMDILHDSYPGQWAGLAVTKDGRSLLGTAYDLSVPPYLMNSRPAWCQMLTTNGWFVNVFQLESLDLERPILSTGAHRSAKVRPFPSPEIEL